MRQVLLDGMTDEGLSLKVWEGTQIASYKSRFTVELDGQYLKILEASRLRDGGTTIIETLEGSIRIPQTRFSRDDGPYMPTFRGKTVVSVQDPDLKGQT